MSTSGKIDFAGLIACQSKCEAWFPGNFTLVSGCKAACTQADRPKTQCDYLEKWVGDQQSIALYGIDCDTASGAGSSRFAEAADQQQKYVLVAVVVVIFILLLYFLFR